MAVKKYYSIKELYEIAFLEGEGMGTAYEYFGKQKIMKNFVKEHGMPSRILIYGLPEKYGTSMDFILFGFTNNYSITVCEDRITAIEKFKNSLDKFKKKYPIKEEKIKILKLESLTNCKWLENNTFHYDLVVNTDTFQRFSNTEQIDVIKCIMQMGKKALLFMPNGDNINHKNLPGWKGVLSGELIKSVSDLKKCDYRFGFIDMPPFPSGYKLTEQKQSLLSQRKAVLFFGTKFLEMWSVIEKIIPDSIKRKFSHAFYLSLTSK